jgi:hypothetical protein
MPLRRKAANRGISPSSAFTFWVGFFVLSCLKAVKYSSSKWLNIAACLFGVSMATKYLAFPLIAGLFVAQIFVDKKIYFKRVILMGLLSGTFFALGNPYMVLDFNAFLEGLRYVANASEAKSSQSWNFAPFNLGYTMGWPLFFTSLLGFGWALKNKDRQAIVILTCLTGYLFLLSTSSLVTGRYNLLPAFLLIPFAGKVVEKFWGYLKSKPNDQSLKYNLAFFVAMGFLLYPSLGYSMAFSHTLSEKGDVRDLASVWITKNIPSGSSIGLVREAYWYSPGVIFEEYKNIDLSENTREKLHYQFQLLDIFKPELWADTKPKYLILTDAECKLMHGTFDFPAHLEKLGYQEVFSMDRMPSINKFIKFPKKSYHALEWRMPFPAIKIWIRS